MSPEAPYQTVTARQLAQELRMRLVAQRDAIEKAIAAVERLIEADELPPHAKAKRESH